MTRRVRLAIRARQHGASGVLRIFREADRIGIPYSYALALVQQESGFRNVFGSDPTIFIGAGTVTKDKVQDYLRQRGRRGENGMQGVGLTQLTWWSYQNEAEAMGGLHLPVYQLRVGFRVLKNNIIQYGKEQGFARYNGSGPAAQRYADQVLAKQDRWHRILT